MKIPILFFSFLFFSGLLSAQDTIFVKSGQVIPAEIVEKNEMEIKYKKFGMPEPAAIYSVFVSDITSIHYKNGIVADYTAAGQNETGDQPKSALEMAGTMRTMKLSLVLSGSYFNRNESDNLQKFWDLWGGNSAIGGNQIYYPVSMKMSFSLGQAGRNWIGDELQIIITPEDAIFASSNNGANEIKLKSFYYNIVMYYGHTLNHKKNLLAIIEPGLDLAFSSGYIKINNTKYDVSGNLGAGWHLALGTDWIISKRFMACLRVGQKFMTIKEEHKNSESSSGYSTFYVNHAVNDDLLSVKWSGPYATIGLAWSFYSKMKYGNTE